jgi:hypothetical protein
MSRVIKVVHPNINLDGESNRERPAYPLQDMLAGYQDARTFHMFEDLPSDIQSKIFRLWFFFDNRLIHCLSRLDPYHYPRPGDFKDGKPRLLHRFYLGSTRNFSIRHDTVDPNSLLRLFLVSKSFYFKGSHAFYGLNTFAFSSLGEFGRFSTGIGEARAARIQNIEIVWRGSQYLTIKPMREESSKLVKKSKRTSALETLPMMKRLKTMVVFLNEQREMYIRRRYEPRHLQEYMMQCTRGQPNKRMTRSLRTLQGLDYIGSLRGLKWARFYDLDIGIDENARRESVLDTTFLADLNSTVTMPKVPSRQEESELEQLPPLSQNWNPSDLDLEVVREFYTSNPVDDVFEATRTYYGVYDTDPDGPVSESEDGDDDDEGNDDDDDQAGNDSDDELDEPPVDLFAEQPEAPRQQNNPIICDDVDNPDDDDEPIHPNAEDVQEDERMFISEDEDTDGNDTDGNDTDGNDTDGNDTDGNDTDGNDTDGNDTDGNDTDGNDTDGNDTDDGDADDGDADDGDADDGDADDGDADDGDIDDGDVGMMMEDYNEALGNGVISDAEDDAMTIQPSARWASCPPSRIYDNFSETEAQNTRATSLDGLPMTRINSSIQEQSTLTGKPDMIINPVTAGEQIDLTSIEDDEIMVDLPDSNEDDTMTDSESCCTADSINSMLKPEWDDEDSLSSY